MRALIIAGALLLAVPAQAASWQCVLWPSACKVQVPAEPEPVLPPIASEPVLPPPAAAPVPAPPPIVSVRPPAPKPTAKPRPRIKAKFAKPKRAAVPSWCRYVPPGTTMKRIEDEAEARGKVMSASHRQQAKACIASK